MEARGPWAKSSPGRERRRRQALAPAGSRETEAPLSCPQAACFPLERCRSGPAWSWPQEGGADRGAIGVRWRREPAER